MNIESDGRAFQAKVTLWNGASTELPISATAPLFVLGPNGAGKSGLMLSLFRLNSDRAVRIAAHRQTWMDSNLVPFSPRDKITNENNVKSWDQATDARWREVQSGIRPGLAIANIVEAENDLAREVRSAFRSGKTTQAGQLAEKLSPIDTINELFLGAGIPIVMTIEQNGAIVASKRGGSPYSIAALSDGERAAFLIAGLVLTAKSESLILIDEPERHLHVAIVMPLLLELFAQRPDCTFVVSTHELNLPIGCPTSRTILVRDAMFEQNEVAKWDLDVVEPGVGIDDQTKEAIIGSRRKILFIEGTSRSLDNLLYQILFPGVSIVPRASCGEVENAVTSIRQTQQPVWIQAFGIVDQDQLSPEKKLALELQGVFALSVYSVEGLYYNRMIVEAVARRQSEVLGSDADQMVAAAWNHLIAAIASGIDRLAARMTEQTVKDQVSLAMLDWKKIQAGHNIMINVDAQFYYRAEQAKLRHCIQTKDIDELIGRYPIRETTALTAIASALQFRNRSQYEAAVRKLVADNSSIRDALKAHFGGLPAAMR